MKAQILRSIACVSLGAVVLLACGGDTLREGGIRPEELSALEIEQGVAGRFGMLVGCRGTTLFTPDCIGPTEFTTADAEVVAFADWEQRSKNAQLCSFAGGAASGVFIGTDPDHRSAPNEEGIYGLELPPGTWTVRAMDATRCVLDESNRAPIISAPLDIHPEEVVVWDWVPTVL